MNKPEQIDLLKVMTDSQAYLIVEKFLLNAFDIGAQNKEALITPPIGASLLRKLQMSRAYFWESVELFEEKWGLHLLRIENPTGVQLRLNKKGARHISRLSAPQLWRVSASETGQITSMDFALGTPNTKHPDRLIQETNPSTDQINRMGVFLNTMAIDHEILTVPALDIPFLKKGMVVLRVSGAENLSRLLTAIPALCSKGPVCTRPNPSQQEVSKLENLDL